MQGFRKGSWGCLGLCSSGAACRGGVGRAGSQSPLSDGLLDCSGLCSALGHRCQEISGALSQGSGLAWGSLEGGATLPGDLALPFPHSPSDLASLCGEVQWLLQAAQLGCAWA